MSLDHNAWVTAGCQTLSRTNADLSPRNEHELDPKLCVFIEHHYKRKPVCGHWIYPLQRESKQTLFYVPWTVKDRTHGPALRSGFASGHRVALVVHRAQKSVPDSAGEWPTFLPPPLESCSSLYKVAYHRPTDNDESVNGLEAALDDLQYITKNKPKSSIIVAGDFNAKDIQWDTLSISPECN